ncbi:MAG: queuosine precursor transporter [Dongiaceae bacterium]
MSLRVTSHDYEWHPKYFGVIVGLFCALYMITGVAVLKMVDFGPFILPAAIITFPLCCIITDLLTEVYGFNRTRQAVWTALVCTFLFAVFTQITIYLPPADFWPHQEAFAAIFKATPRIALAGMLAWVVGEFSNTYVMSKMKIAQNAKNMSVRFVASTAVGQFFDSLVFFSVAFAGTLPWDVFFKIMITGWLAKVAYEAVSLPISIPVTKWVKRLEGVEHFDKQKLSLV